MRSNRYKSHKTRYSTSRSRPFLSNFQRIVDLYKKGDLGRGTDGALNLFYKAYPICTDERRKTPANVFQFCLMQLDRKNSGRSSIPESSHAAIFDLLFCLFKENRSAFKHNGQRMDGASARATAIEISTIVHRLGRHATSDWSAHNKQALNACCWILLKSLLYSANLDAQSIGNTVHGLGKLAEQGLLTQPIKIDAILSLLKKLDEINPHAQNIGNMVHGLGKLAEQGLLTQPIEMDAILSLLKKLSAGNPTAQNIGNTVHGLGKLAEQGLLTQPIDTGVILSLLKKLSAGNPHAQEIGNTVHGLGKLAERGLLTPPIEMGIILSLLKKLDEINPDAQSIGNTVHGLGKLAERGLLTSPIEIDAILSLLKKLSAGNPNAQSIGNTVHGLGKLAEQGVFTQPIGIDAILSLLKKLDEINPNAQSIGNTVHGLGKLAEQGVFTQPIGIDAILSLLKKLSAGNPNAQNIGNTVHGLGKLAEQELLTPPIEMGVILFLLKKLDEINPDAQSIGNTVHGLGKLAERGLLTQPVEMGVILSLLKKLSAGNPNAQEISNTVHGLGKLAEQGLLTQPIEMGVILSLLKKLSARNPNAQEISNTVHGLGKLARRGVLSVVGLDDVGSEAAVTISGMNSVLRALLNKLEICSDLNDQNIGMAVTGITCLYQHGTFKLGIDVLQKLAETGEDKAVAASITYTAMVDACYFYEDFKLAEQFWLAKTGLRLGVQRGAIDLHGQSPGCAYTAIRFFLKNSIEKDKTLDTLILIVGRGSHSGYANVSGQHPLLEAIHTLAKDMAIPMEDYAQTEGVVHFKLADWRQRMQKGHDMSSQRRLSGERHSDAVTHTASQKRTIFKDGTDFSPQEREKIKAITERIAALRRKGQASKKTSGQRKLLAAIKHCLKIPEGRNIKVFTQALNEIDCNPQFALRIEQALSCKKTSSRRGSSDKKQIEGIADSSATPAITDSASKCAPTVTQHEETGYLESAYNAGVGFFQSLCGLRHDGMKDGYCNYTGMTTQSGKPR